MQRILFVDDEPKLLSGLRRMLHAMRGQWHMDFAGSGAEALTRLLEQPFDIVVTDMRMPFMDGSELLRLIRERFPSTIRMVLSGQCDRHAVLKAVGPAHQFLTKPCNSETLKESLNRASQLRDRLGAAWPREVVSCVEAVPSLPDSLADLSTELAEPDSGNDQIGRIIGNDPGMAVRVLQLVNSGFYGSPQRTSDPPGAASLLGAERLRELIDSSEAFVATTPGQPHWIGVADVVEHSRAVSEAAESIAASESDDPHLIAEARWGGLLHDVGALVLLQQVPERYAAVLMTRTGSQCICDREQAEFDADHAAMGAYLLALWGLPDSVVRITALHHAPAESDDCNFTALTAVHAADCLTGDPEDHRKCTLDFEYIERIGKSDRIAAWTELCRTLQPEGILA
ncbi:MAG: HDOD domain-containing protein [Thermoguttaceae bacterium]|jgi:putative nucleotidyltransferase with HDIG domain|nr:HDOD domain-containing protein [Thermoguttaceae bacterium]